MRFPKYQWLQEEPADTCGFCDVLYRRQYGASTNDAFQVILDTASISDDKIAANPFDLITSTDLTFDLEQSPIGYQLVLNIESNVYVIEWGVLTAGTTYSYTQSGNVYFIQVELDTALAARLNFRQMLIDIIDANHGTTSSLVSTTFTIANIPAGSYLSNYLFITGIGTVTASTNRGEYVYWNDGTLCYKVVGDTGLDMVYEFQQALTAGSPTMFKYYYTSTSASFVVTVTLDDGVNVPTVITPEIASSGYFSFNFEPALTATHTITLNLVDPNNIEEGFCIEQISIETLYLISNVQFEDCDGNITDVTWDDTGNVIYENTILIDVMEAYPEVFRFIITSSDPYALPLTSRWYKIADESVCTNGTLYSIEWYSDCDLDEIKYADLPFVNELLLTGVLIKQGNELIDNIDSITSTGRKISVYKNTQSYYELRLHPYLAETMELIIERIFDHKTVLINGIEYNTTDVFQVSEIDLGRYTGRVDLYKSGTNLIVSGCC